jgi:hypothetical protein
MDVFELLAEKQIKILQLFQKLRRSGRNLPNSHCATEVYILEVEVIEELTSYLNMQLEIFHHYAEIGYENLLKPMFIYRADVRQLLLAIHDHQEKFVDPESIIHNYKDFLEDIILLSKQFRKSIERDQKHFSEEFQTILEKTESFHKNFIIRD